MWNCEKDDTKSFWMIEYLYPTFDKWLDLVNPKPSLCPSSTLILAILATRGELWQYVYQRQSLEKGGANRPSFFLPKWPKVYGALSEMAWSNRSKLKSWESTAIVIDHPTFSSCFVNQKAGKQFEEENFNWGPNWGSGRPQVSEQVRKAAVRKEMLPFAYIIQAVFLNAPPTPYPLSSVPKSNLEANHMLTHLAHR